MQNERTHWWSWAGSLQSWADSLQNWADSLRELSKRTEFDEQRRRVELDVSRIIWVQPNKKNYLAAPMFGQDTAVCPLNMFPTTTRRTQKWKNRRANSQAWCLYEVWQQWKGIVKKTKCVEPKYTSPPRCIEPAVRTNHSSRWDCQ